MDAMREMPDKAFELAIVDPPYFEEYGKEIYPGAAISTTGIKRNRFASSRWNVPDKKYFDELLRVSANQIIWGFNYYGVDLGSGRIIWDKQNDLSSFSKCEIAFCSMHKSVQIFRYTWNGMMQGNMKNKEIRIHPTQKPVALYEWILNHYAKEGDRILDTHVGSASSLIACHRLGFEYWGFEIDFDYYKAANERLEKEKAQLNMFQAVASEARQTDIFGGNT
jgi:site-specific DNA-methyltransferase (adenine-specific)